MGPNSKVILAEDDLTMQTVLRTLLELEGFAVSIAPIHQSQEALFSFIRSEHPDAILLDVHLGETSGFEVLRQIRQDPVTSQIRIIMTSGMDVHDRCLAAGADGFVLKPFMPDELIQKLHG